MTVTLRRADITCAEKIWGMQKVAFKDLLVKYQDFETNPANEPLDKVIIRLKQPFTYFYFIEVDGTKIGAIRVVDKKDNNEPKKISPLFILPKYRNKGYAQAAIIEVEKIHGSRGWEFDTILQEAGNCHLYEKSGYTKTGKTKKVNDRMTLVYYKK